MENLQNELFSTIPKRDPLEIFKNHVVDKGRLGEIPKFLELEKQDISKATGIPKSSIRYDEKMPKALMEHLFQLAAIFILVSEHFEGNLNKTYAWFNLPNPLMGNLSPRDMIRYGRFKKVLKIVQSAIEGESP